MHCARRGFFSACLVLGLLLLACSDDGDTRGSDVGLADAALDGGADLIQADGASPKSDSGTAVEEYKEEVEQLVQPILQDGWAMGLVVGLVHEGGNEIYGFGKLQDGDATPPDGDTLFEIGSITKTFTSLILAQMIEDGTLTLDTPAQELLPADKVTLPTKNGKVITLKHLSTHHSGLPRMPSNCGNVYPANPCANYGASQMYIFLNGYTLPREPGASFEYSNLAVGLLGHALSLEAGKPFEELVSSVILDPLSMQNTAITLSPEQQQRFAQGHNGDLEPMPAWSFDVLAPAGALRSSAKDMLLYLAAQCGLENSPLQAAIQASHEPQVSLGQSSAIGLAWFIDEQRYLSHTGDTGGFCTFAGFDAQTGRGVVVLANTAVHNFWPVDQLGAALLQMLGGETVAPLDLPASKSLPVHTLDNYVGTYEGMMGTKKIQLDITREQDHLYLLRPLQPLQPKMRLYADTESEFYLRMAPVLITFIKDSQGQVTSLLFLETGTTPFTADRVE